MAENFSFEKELEKLTSAIKGFTLRFPERHRDDLFQEGVMGLYYAFESFDSDKGIPFEPYAMICVRNKMYSYCTRFIKNDVAYTESSDDISSSALVEEDVLDRTFIDEVFGQLRESLTELENGVLDLYLKDLTYSQISSAMNITEKSVDNAMSRIKSKLKKVFRSQI